MGTDLRHDFAIYPMVEEAEATGVVAAVYVDVLERLPMVPSVFKSLAACPGYLVLAWEQATGVVDGEAFAAEARRLSESARDAARPPDRADCREQLGGFVDPLARMLLVSTGLHQALTGHLEGRPAPGLIASDSVAGSVKAVPSSAVPSQWEAGRSDVFGEIRAALQTPIINSVWRALAGTGLLEATWAALRPQVDAIWPVADRLQADALETVPALPWGVVASPTALVNEGLGDAAPAMESVLDAYVKTLPRVLALAASSAP